MLGGIAITLADVVVFAVCELIAIPLCDASWHAIVAEDAMIRGLIGLAFGIPVGVVGFTFLWWRGKARDRVLKFAKDWWPLPAVAIVAYLINPTFYSRLRLMLPWVGPVVWNVDDPNTAGFFIGMQQQRGQEIRVLNFQASGRNTSPNAISSVKGYIKSLTTNRELPIYLIVIDTVPNIPFQVPVPIAPEETYGIPPYADFLVTTAKVPFPDPQKDGLSVTQFLSDFASFDFVFEYDGRTYKHHFSTEDVKKQFDTFKNISSPEKSTTTPRIVKRESIQEKAPDAH